MPRRPRTLLTAVLVLAALAAVVAWAVVLPARVDAAATEVARRYAALVADGDEADLQDLWTMTASEQPGAMRTAGELLLGARERIEVVSVGEARDATGDVQVPEGVALGHLTVVPVRVRLDGEEGDWSVVLGRRAGTSGTSTGDWRVLDRGLRSIEWAAAGFADVDADVYVSGVRQVRRPKILGGSDEEVQPLYPAVYRVQRRLGPWFASAEQDVVVRNGASSVLPDPTLRATARTEDRITRQVWRRFAACADPTDFTCPAGDLAEAAGADTYTRRWWRGLVERPEVGFDGDRLTLTDGAFEVRTRGGATRTVRFDGTGRYVLDNQSWTPAIWDLDLAEAS